AASYACGESGGLKLELRHPSDPAAEGAPGAARTAQFVLVPRGAVPPSLVAALAERVAAREGGWRWLSAEAPGLGKVGDAAAPVAALTPEQSEELMAAVAL